MKFLVDMPLSPSLADWLTEQGHDAVHASRIGLALETDDRILGHADREHRVVVTVDLDFSRLIALAHGPGLILFRSGDWSEAEAVARMARALETVPETELPNSVIERTRIRKRRLPVK